MILNNEQKKVVESNEPFLFLLASAGSGKTRVIVEKIKKLIHDGINPEHILAITFTRKSALEMMERLDESEISIHTFHQFCFQKLKAYSSYEYDLIDEKHTTFSKEELLKITKYKNGLYRTRKPKIFNSYQSYLTSNHLKDFDDLLLDFIKLIQMNLYINPYRYIFIDEFQDTNLLQYEVLKKLIHKQTHVLAVGDPDQSIYHFRGASAKIISLYIEDYQAKTYILSTNYRSTPEIIRVANNLIKRNNRRFKKVLTTVNPSFVKPYVIKHHDETEESKYIFEKIKDFKKAGIKDQQIAILFRNHYRSYTLKYMLDTNDISYQHEDRMDNQGIHLISMHQAKGLEFDIVIIIGCEKYVIPSIHDYTQTEQDEERRLMFVAITRAKKQLILSYVTYNSFNVLQKPSIFIKECGLKSKKTNE